MSLFSDNKRLIIWSIVGTGISSITVQLVTIREFLTQFHGNEITISLVLFCWLILTGIGSLGAKAFKRASLTLYSLLVLWIAIWPLAQIFIIRHFREVLFIHGASPGFYQIFFYIVITIAPYCLLTGFILPYALAVLNVRHEDFSAGELYMVDNIGDILGGILFSFILVYWLKPFKVIAITSGLLILTGFFLMVQTRRSLFLIVSVLLIALFYGYSTNIHFERSSLIRQYGDIVRYEESPYGRIVITNEGPQNTIWETGRPLYSEANVIDSEEKIHYPLSQLEQVQNVLLISGGLGETLNELYKYKPTRIDYVELDPRLTNIAQEEGFLKTGPSLEVVNSDARLFIQKIVQKYDAIIIDLPDPDTFQINRFFTSEFFSLAKKALKREGILSFSMKYSLNYISDIRKQKLSTAYNSARLHFKNIIIIPGGEAYFLCRDMSIDLDIPTRLRSKSISTKYIEGFYYGNVSNERISHLHNSIDRDEVINTDFNPRMMKIVFQEWFVKHGTTPRAFLLIFSVMLFLYLIAMKKEEYILFTTGIAVMGVEMLMIFLFQVLYGYIYLKIGAIVTVFLMGLFPGAAIGILYKGEKRQC